MSGWKQQDTDSKHTCCLFAGWFADSWFRAAFQTNNVHVPDWFLREALDILFAVSLGMRTAASRAASHLLSFVQEPLVALYVCGGF